jgi:hypothetical protein
MLVFFFLLARISGPPPFSATITRPHRSQVVLKTAVGATPPWVRIPPLPPVYRCEPGTGWHPPGKTLLFPKGLRQTPPPRRLREGRFLVSARLLSLEVSTSSISVEINNFNILQAMRILMFRNLF